jgi:signal transduction histidine kinase
MENSQASDIRTPRWDNRAKRAGRARSDGHLSVAGPLSTAEPDAGAALRLRRLERDLHDGVQNELVALIIELSLAREDPRVPPPLAARLAGLEARAQAALDTVRGIAHGTRPPLLAEFGVAEALRARAAAAAIQVSVSGSVPRSIEGAENAAYFSCSEAIQNASKHAGAMARMTIWLHHRGRTLTALITDDGRGFDPRRIPDRGGLRNIRDRIEALDGGFAVASEPGCGTALTISLPWPVEADER